MKSLVVQGLGLASWLLSSTTIIATQPIQHPAALALAVLATELQSPVGIVFIYGNVEKRDRLFSAVM